MPKVIVHDGESLHSAIKRFRKSVHYAYRRRFYKTRVGYYEKPSDRKRRAKRASRRRIRLRQRSGPSDYIYYIGLHGLHSRGEGPFRTREKQPGCWNAIDTM